MRGNCCGSSAQAGYGLVNLQREVSRLFDGLVAGDNAAQPAVAFHPRLDVSEADTAIHVTIDLPGIPESAVQVELKADALHIRGEKSDPRQTDGHQYHRIERLHGKFERVLTLRTEINRDQVTATFKNGVLEVVLPKDLAKTATKQVVINPVA